VVIPSHSLSKFSEEGHGCGEPVRDFGAGGLSEQVKQLKLSAVDDPPGNHPGGIRRIFDFWRKPQLARAAGARAPGHRHPLPGVMPGVAARAEDGDQLAVARIVMDVRRVEILVFRSALGTAVTGKCEQCFAITAPFRPVILAQLGADRHCVHYHPR